MTTIKLLDKEVELYETYEFQIADDAITELGIKQINHYLLSLSSIKEWCRQKASGETPETYDEYIARRYKFYSFYSNGITWPDDWQWRWVVGGKGVYVGTLPKRISKYVKNMTGITLTTDQLSYLGVLASTNSLNREVHAFDFANEFDWSAGDYGESESSCWWGSNDYARTMLKDNGGLAIRFFQGKDGGGKARAWLVVRGDHLILFNGYGFASGYDSTLIIVRILATWLGLSYKKIELKNCGESGGVLYINGGNGYAIGKDSVLANIHGVDFEWDDDGNGDSEECWGCDERYDRDDMHYHDDHYFCESCFDDAFAVCSQCDETISRDNVSYHDGSYVCDDCLAEHYFDCDECGDTTHRDDSYWVQEEDVDLCRSCFRAYISACNECGNDFFTKNLHDGLCESCVRETETVEGENNV